ncbi:hypothetical protein GPECTOR_70g474 [Gonium pectorale]|uniref:Uncharacterized protein n=1 Tax=Gonium pectorale TaxID=33097 RepID=A0A150G353_GONPE|nr:hypothetical protein GPECTOR_70g474 [Gonium pectorale]|eukprot:KXZ44244.1 hypothetical protein GPECTOR_70g474 [Gonium pectorale]
METALMPKTEDKRACGMTDLNMRNRQHNLVVAYKTTAAEEHGGNDGTGGADVFSRRATTLKNYWKTKGSGGSRDDDAGGQSAGAAAAAKAQASLPEKLTRAQQRMDPAELIRQLGLDVDLTLLRSTPLVPPLQQRLLPSKWRGSSGAHGGLDLAGKSVLSLADYKRRAGDF